MRLRQYILLFVPVIFSLVLFCGCNQKHRYRIGVSQCSFDDWRMKMNDEINREMMLHDDAEVEIRSAQDNNNRQIADIRYFIDQKFDIIIVAPNEAEAITPIVKEAYDKGIPVIVFDRDIIGDSYTAKIGVDNLSLGREAAEYARKLMPSPVNIIELRGLDKSTPAAERRKGFADEAARMPGMNILASTDAGWYESRARTGADSMLRLFPQANLIYAHNDRMAIGAAKAAHALGRDSIRVIGIDAAPEIGIRAVADSVIDATFLYPTEGDLLIRTAMNILKGEPFERETVLPTLSPIDRSNANIMLSQADLLKSETDKVLILKDKIDEYWARYSSQTFLLYLSIAFVVVLIVSVSLMLRLFWQNTRHRHTLEQQNALLEHERDMQKSLNDQLKEATQSKLIFFTNVSHDLRTPLTLIAEPVEQLAAADNLTPRQHTLVRIADKNVRILRRLINQILDFRSYENGKMALNLAEINIGDTFREWAEAFNAIALKRDIKLKTEIDPSASITLAVDPEKLERVFFNLMSNAFRYTPDNGSITFSCRVEGDSLVFAVADTGVGISSEDINYIFERFYQVDKVRPKGSGIGLALVKAFVELHGGRIEVDSRPGGGTRFTVTLPVRHTDAAPDETRQQLYSASDVSAELGDIDRAEPAAPDNDTDKPLMLVVDDNDDIRRMVRELMSDEYAVIEARNGLEGVRMAARYIPDLVVCDVMMPVMDGLECCRRIKSEISTSHIPVLMLTACSMDEQRAEGYESGADGYLAKPFSSAVMRARCHSLIENRRRIKDLWNTARDTKSDTAAASKTAATPPAGNTAAPAGPLSDAVENEFYARFIDTAMREMGNPDLNIDQLAARMSLGRSQLYRKIKALTNYSPVEILRRLRLNKAREMLTTTSKSISEIAYEVGFSTPAYFTKCYRESFGQTPSELREQLGIKN